MTTKTATKQQAPKTDETKLAYETHTLAQLIYANDLRRIPGVGESREEEAMFWNEPILYGATLPFKDVPLQTPWAGMFPQHNIPRYLPQNYGFTTPLNYNYNVPQFQQIPQIPQVNPFMQVPQVPQMGFTPFVRPEWNQPFYGFNRQFYNFC
jgi:hypothetical protein